MGGGGREINFNKIKSKIN